MLDPRHHVCCDALDLTLLIVERPKLHPFAHGPRVPGEKLCAVRSPRASARRLTITARRAGGGGEAGRGRRPRPHRKPPTGFRRGQLQKPSHQVRDGVAAMLARALPPPRQALRLVGDEVPVVVAGEAGDRVGLHETTRERGATARALSGRGRPELGPGRGHPATARLRRWAVGAVGIGGCRYPDIRVDPGAPATLAVALGRDQPAVEIGGGEGEPAAIALPDAQWTSETVKVEIPVGTWTEWAARCVRGACLAQYT